MLVLLLMLWSKFLRSSLLHVERKYILAMTTLHFERHGLPSIRPSKMSIASKQASALISVHFTLLKSAFCFWKSLLLISPSKIFLPCRLKNPTSNSHLRPLVLISSSRGTMAKRQPFLKSRTGEIHLEHRRLPNTVAVVAWHVDQKWMPTRAATEQL